MTQLSSSLSLIAGALGGDPSDMDEAFRAELAFPGRFAPLEGDPAAVEVLPAGTVVLVDPAPEAGCFTAYVVRGWVVYSAPLASAGFAPLGTAAAALAAEPAPALVAA